MDIEKNVFCSYHGQDQEFFNQLRRFLRKNGIIAFERNLYNHFAEQASRLFTPSSLDKVLAYPDLALVLLSENFIRSKDEWTSNELHALYMLEQSRRTNFLLPVLTGRIKDDEIPNYFKEHPDRYVDFRQISPEKAMLNLKEAILRAAKKKVFIGHGRSPDWKDLRDYLRDRLKLECDHFEAAPPAGFTITARMSEMLGNARFAFLVMTAEDEHLDNTKHARENVIHEIGLFQGKLGFERAIILLENGCTEFSNKSGILHISFRRGEIDGCFEEIRKVLEREGITS